MPTALLYDVHGNLPALEAVLADAREEAADRWVLGGDLVAFGAWPRECLAALRDLPGAIWIRGNTERWLSDRHDTPEPMDQAALACRAALGDADADALFRLPGTATVGETLYCHASPDSDMASFLPQAQDGDAALLGDLDADRVVFGHTHLQFRRGGPRGVELVNPGSVGMPLDGDHRAAYALVHDDGDLELRRVDYDRDAAVAGLDGPDPWREVVQGRLRRAAP
ncbi:MAG TPA: metallophosphoesterase family protein [Baekduia sp.]|nr:metallophosphoesterase family protein [Baekduia sp.]